MMKTDNEENIMFDINSLRPIARQRLDTLLKKMNETGRYELYKEEIIKLIKKEVKIKERIKNE